MTKVNGWRLFKTTSNGANEYPTYSVFIFNEKSIIRSGNQYASDVIKIKGDHDVVFNMLNKSFGQEIEPNFINESLIFLK